MFHVDALRIFMLFLLISKMMLRLKIDSPLLGDGFSKVFFVVIFTPGCLLQVPLQLTGAVFVRLEDEDGEELVQVLGRWTELGKGGKDLKMMREYVEKDCRWSYLPTKEV